MSDVLLAQFRTNGDLWVSTTHGLYLHNNSGNIWKDVYDTRSYLQHNVMEIFQSDKGELWIGTGEGIVIVYPDQSVKSITAINAKALGLITGINQDKEGNIWISSMRRW